MLTWAEDMLCQALGTEPLPAPSSMKVKAMLMLMLMRCYNTILSSALYAIWQIRHCWITASVN